jgi:hypothetical protein
LVGVVPKGEIPDSGFEIRFSGIGFQADAVVDGPIEADRTKLWIVEPGTKVEVIKA